LKSELISEVPHSTLITTPELAIIEQLKYRSTHTISDPIRAARDAPPEKYCPSSLPAKSPMQMSAWADQVSNGLDEQHTETMAFNI
jgi:hypothetical protein